MENQYNYYNPNENSNNEDRQNEMKSQERRQPKRRTKGKYPTVAAGRRIIEKEKKAA